MNDFQLSSPRQNSVWAVYRIRDRIDLNPVYQRDGEIWNDDKRQLLIDTILNGFDVPKIYLHKFPEPIEKDGHNYDFAVIDGKQRLNAIWKFIDGAIALADGFEYLRDAKVKLGGFTYKDLAREYVEIKNDFDTFLLDIVAIETQDTELIEDLFSRLNEAMPLSAAEKRNARPGPLPVAVRSLCTLPFFAKKLPFKNTRYRHYDLAAKMLMLTGRAREPGNASKAYIDRLVVDTKKVYLDRFFDDHAKSTSADVEPMVTAVTEALDAMSAVFIDADPFLRSVGMITLYFNLFRAAFEKKQLDHLTRPTFDSFDKARNDNRRMAEDDIAKADYDLLEFDRYTQSLNDAGAMKFRLKVIDRKVFSGRFGFEGEEGRGGGSQDAIC
jgi:Protein of unknown function DUF262